jgi:hypothetical protein
VLSGIEPADLIRAVRQQDVAGRAHRPRVEGSPAGLAAGGRPG